MSLEIISLVVESVGIGVLLTGGVGASCREGEVVDGLGVEVRVGVGGGLFFIGAGLQPTPA